MLVVVGETQDVQSANFEKFSSQDPFLQSNKEGMIQHHIWLGRFRSKIQNVLRGLMAQAFEQYTHLMHQEPVVIFFTKKRWPWKVWKTIFVWNSWDILTQTLQVLKSWEEKSKKVISNVLDPSILYKDNLNLMNLKHQFPAKTCKVPLNLHIPCKSLRGAPRFSPWWGTFRCGGGRFRDQFRVSSCRRVEDSVHPECARRGSGWRKSVGEKGKFCGMKRAWEQLSTEEQFVFTSFRYFRFLSTPLCLPKSNILPLQNSGFCSDMGLILEAMKHEEINSPSWWFCWIKIPLMCQDLWSFSRIWVSLSWCHFWLQSSLHLEVLWRPSWPIVCSLA